MRNLGLVFGRAGFFALTLVAGCSTDRDGTGIFVPGAGATANSDAGSGGETDGAPPSPRPRDDGPPTTVSSCGNGRVDDIPPQAETCDDGNRDPGDGCDAECLVEAGYACPQQGGLCVAAECGDGLLAGDEVCDDGNVAPEDGCDAGCNLEWGFACPTPGESCVAIVCGDAKAEGLEQCDDGNQEIGDGCTPFCQREPQCTDGICESACGDNIVGNGEECDDGNQQDDDGCSSSCQLEPGFECRFVRSEEPDSVSLPIVLRDFRGRDLTNGHPDFEGNTGSERNLVETQLAGSPGKPVLRPANGSNTTTGPGPFSQWYRSTPGVNLTVVDQLVLDRQAQGTYVFDNENFFPLDGRGFNGLPSNDPLFEASRVDGHNFHFTSEVRYWFEYRGTEVLDFRGDDDVWVFINGRLAVDLGGVHGAESGSVTLADRAQELGLTIGGIYEAVVFQAERHTSKSSYKLTLTNFLTERTVCEGVCGNGIKTPGEQCDDGNDTDDDACNNDCELVGVNIL